MSSRVGSKLRRLFILTCALQFDDDVIALLSIGHLASIRSTAEARFINTHVIGEDVNLTPVWIGCNRSGVHGSGIPFQWIDDFSPARLDSGETMWKAGQPDNSSIRTGLGRKMADLMLDYGENCCMAKPQEEMVWTDEACHNILSYVCKAPVEWLSYGGT